MTMIYQWKNYFISKEKRYLDGELIYRFLHEEAYWAEGLPRKLIEKSVENASLCFGLYAGNPHTDSRAQMIGFARMISDFVRFSYLSDVFIIESFRGQGLSKWLIETIVNEPLLKGTAFQLATKDAHTLYAKFGFKPLPEPENRLMRPLNLNTIYEAYDIKKPWR